MTTSASNEENESSYDVEGFRASMQAMGVKTVKRMGTARDLASVSRSFSFCLVFPCSLEIRACWRCIDREGEGEQMRLQLWIRRLMARYHLGRPHACD